MGDRRSSSQIFREKALGDRHQAARQPQRSRDGISRIASARIGEQTVYAPAMCGRFTQNLSWAEIHRLAGLIGQPRNLAPRFNIAPTTPIEVIRAAAAGNELVPMYWGLIPSWWEKPLKELPSTFNARAETVAERPMFRGASKYRRCIIPASGFYEWTGAKGAKTPRYFTARDGRPLG